MNVKLSYVGLADRAGWAAAGVALPDYDPARLSESTKKDPRWVHFGIGNIFRIFLGGIADALVRAGDTDRGILCAETFDFEVADKVYAPHDNLTLAVTLHADGSKDKRVLGSLCEAVKTDGPDGMDRLREIFESPGLQMVSFTITEKGYALRDAGGRYYPHVLEDMKNGPDAVTGVIGIVTALLLHRFRAGEHPLALVSMDNVSQNGEKLRQAVLETANNWVDNENAPCSFLRYLTDPERITFPWTMIDKITPRPSPAVAEALTAAGVDGMDIIVTDKHTHIAPFVNAEAPQYLVVEDTFPNGRPPLERAGVFMTDRETVNKSERMKVTVCLNPIHTALCTYGILLGYELFADAVRDPELGRLARRLGYGEGLPVVEEPGILSPSAFLDELMTERFPNPWLGDTNQRIAVDISQMTAIRFGETIRAYVDRDGTAEELVAVPLAIAGWIRYLLAVDDEGRTFDLSPDPMLPQLRKQLAEVIPGDPGSLKEQLLPVLSNSTLFGMDLYRTGLGEKIEGMVREQLTGPGAVRETLKRWLSDFGSGK